MRLKRPRRGSVCGLALTDELLDPILTVIGNTEAIAINQAWAGHPGGLVQSIYSPPQPYSPSGVTVPSSCLTSTRACCLFLTRHHYQRYL